MLRTQSHSAAGTRRAQLRTQGGSAALVRWAPSTWLVLLVACTPIAAVTPTPEPDGEAGAAGHEPPSRVGDKALGDLSNDRVNATAGPAASADPVQPCSTAGVRACALNEARSPLQCDGARWVREPACAEDEHCDPMPGAGEGRCTPIPEECVGRKSGDLYCGESDIRSCRMFVPNILRSCDDQQTCMLVKGEPECVCALGSVMQSGRCEIATDCSQGQGGCDRLTSCNMVAGERACGPCPGGYTGDGLRGCVPQLTRLELRDAALTPGFARATTSYAVKLPLLHPRLQVMAEAPAGSRIAINGSDLASDGSWTSPVLPLGQHTVAVVVTAESGLSSRYELMIERGSAQESALRHAQADSQDAFGYGLAISGDTLVVGAVYEDSAASSVNGDQANDAAADSGAAYVFVRRGERWVQQAYLKSDAPSVNDFFGVNVAIDGDTLAVSATRASPYGNISSTRNGLVFVFTRSGEVWTQQARLSAPEAAGADLFGFGLALHGERLVVGAPLDSSGGRQSGAAYVFTRSGGSWDGGVKLKAAQPSAEAYLGWSVALDGDSVLAGAHHDNQASTGSGAGTAHVFVRRDESWAEQQVLRPARPESGDMFGWSVALLGDTAVVGAPHGDVLLNTTRPSGRAHVFARQGERWQLSATLEPTTPRDNDCFGTAVALSNAALVVGASGDGADEAAMRSSGAAYVYARTDAASGSWTRTSFLKAAPVTRDAFFGKRVALSPERMVVSALGEDDQIGTVYVFR